MRCAAPPTGSGFLQGALLHLDCQAQTLGAAGYQALGSTGSPVGAALSMLLALFIAGLGFRLLTGRTLSTHDWMSGAIKIALVLLIATSWPAYKIIVYDLVLKGPAEIAASIGRASSLAGSDGGLAARLDGVDTGIMAFVEAGSGRLDIASRRLPGAVEPPLVDAVALGYAKTLYIGTILGSFGLLRLAGGLFLALAPLFAGFLLFDSTRFLFHGWLRALIAVAFGSIGLTITMGVQLAILEPWLTQVLSLRAARIATLSAPFELFALTAAFAFTTLGVLLLSARVAFSAALSQRIELAMEQVSRQLQSGSGLWQTTSTHQTQSLEAQSRARLIAQQVLDISRREASAASRASTLQDGLRRAADTASNRGGDPALPVPLGRTYATATRRVGVHSMKRRSGS